VTDTVTVNGKHDLRRGIDFTGISCVFICHDGHKKVLMHKRSQNCRDEKGRWDAGGGAHEFGEDLEHSVIREIKEEYGADAFNLRFIKTFDSHRKLDDGTPTHWLVVVYAAQVDPKQAKNNEPHKIDEIGWFSMSSLPKPLHSQIMHELKSVHDLGLI
jgi:8-oxo-dGTP diphosphatase